MAKSAQKLPLATKRLLSFSILLGPGILLMNGMERLGFGGDVALLVLFLPVLGLYIWNRFGERDRFYGMALPTLVFVTFWNIFGVGLDGAGAFYQALEGIGLIGTLLGLLWVMTLLLTLWGPRTGPLS